MEPPEGLHPMQYGVAILENELGWPAKGNCELIADCLTAIQKSKRITVVQAYKYMVRAIRLAKEQGITVDIWFFKYGQYSTIRPPTKQAEAKYCGNCETGWIMREVEGKYGKERRAFPCVCRRAQ